MKHFIIKFILSGHLALGVGSVMDYTSTRQALNIGAIETSPAGGSKKGQIVSLIGFDTVFEFTSYYAKKGGHPIMSVVFLNSMGGLHFIGYAINKSTYKQQCAYNKLWDIPSSCK